MSSPPRGGSGGGGLPPPPRMSGSSAGKKLALNSSNKKNKKNAKGGEPPSPPPHTVATALPRLDSAPTSGAVLTDYEDILRAANEQFQSAVGVLASNVAANDTTASWTSECGARGGCLVGRLLSDGCWYCWINDNARSSL